MTTLFDTCSVAAGEAIRNVCDDRNADYGDPQDNHQRTALLWNAYLEAMPELDLSPTDVCALNIAQKLSRLLNGYHRDSWLDIIGYALNAIAIEEHKVSLADRIREWTEEVFDE